MKILKELNEKYSFRFDDETEKKLLEAGYTKSADGSFYYCYWRNRHIVINIKEDGYLVDFSLWNCETKEDLKEKCERAMEEFEKLEKILGANEDE